MLRFSFSALVFGIALLCGCDQSTLQDTITQQQDRDRVTAQTYLDKYQALDGAYQGSVHDSSNGENVDYAISTTLNTMMVDKDGFSVPQPAIVGSFTLTDFTVKDLDGNPTVTVFPYSDGEFDTPHLALTILDPSKQPAIDVDCIVSSDEKQLDCLWQSQVSPLHFKVILTRQ